MPHPLPTRVLANIEVPDTPLISRAIAYAQSSSTLHSLLHTSTTFLTTPVTSTNFNHVMRSWLFGHYIATHSSLYLSQPPIDAELHAVCAILHDLGWSNDPALSSPDKRFEVDSANAVRQFLLLQNSEATDNTEPDKGGKGGHDKWDTHRIQLAWDSVALHTSASIAMYKQPEVAACCLGVYADFSGWKGTFEGVITEEVWDGICAVYPRHGFKDGVIKALCGLCVRKPETTYDNFVGDFGVVFGVEGYSLVGRRMVDVVKGLEE